ncbi:sterol carrier family protein [Corynebacterium tapiri]|uniref:Bacterial SCP orthologue domain-containing protein n=1 Tax=Corynebacterium tapiri TaxID=1448266 RepID=A0A5C4U367_9CORY|nr:sterol carrier family protein [Corynebacterium tapiri]TNL96101.1 hypothetical protein FHE74_08730 [Corynebacterium tapiri]
MASRIDPAETRAAVSAVLAWLEDESQPAPSRAELALAVRLTARSLAQDAPGQSVELRVPPFVAVQCIDGPRHTRGTPPNVVECSPRTWLQLATGKVSWKQAIEGSLIDASGQRVNELTHWLPVLTP